MVFAPMLMVVPMFFEPGPRLVNEEPGRRLVNEVPLTAESAGR